MKYLTSKQNKNPKSYNFHNNPYKNNELKIYLESFFNKKTISM